MSRGANSFCLVLDFPTLCSSPSSTLGERFKTTSTTYPRDSRSWPSGPLRYPFFSCFVAGELRCDWCHHRDYSRRSGGSSATLATYFSTFYFATSWSTIHGTSNWTTKSDSKWRYQWGWSRCNW
ncbi:unnamed protein product [Hydatigera taeniaeformis]|uniref:Secreted protein n=1 Tax=Hydatigena taeniaeformis TaxID=6205 RepID=A0A0R3XCH7_HYDTA|nr:unnamed protein product [Hydatigera taeniaeformis]